MFTIISPCNHLSSLNWFIILLIKIENWHLKKGKFKHLTGALWLDWKGKGDSSCISLYCSITNCHKFSSSKPQPFIISVSVGQQPNHRVLCLYLTRLGSRCYWGYGLIWGSSPLLSSVVVVEFTFLWLQFGGFHVLVGHQTWAILCHTALATALCRQEVCSKSLLPRLRHHLIRSGPPRSSFSNSESAA